MDTSLCAGARAFGRPLEAEVGSCAALTGVRLLVGEFR